MRISDWSSDVCSSDLRSYDEGGQQLPWTLLQAAFTCFNAANIGSIGYAFLTIGAANMIAAFGSPEQKRRFMQPMFEGRFFGTMCLSEPQAGSGLADIRTRAPRSEEHTSALQSLMRISYAVFCLKKKQITNSRTINNLSFSSTLNT